MSSLCSSRKLHTAQVGDFDLSRVVEGDATASNLTANNPRWLAPEVITSQVRHVLFRKGHSFYSLPPAQLLYRQLRPPRPLLLAGALAEDGYAEP